MINSHQFFYQTSQTNVNGYGFVPPHPKQGLQQTQQVAVVTQPLPGGFASSSYSSAQHPGATRIEPTPTTTPTLPNTSFNYYNHSNYYSSTSTSSSINKVSVVPPHQFGCLPTPVRHPAPVPTAPIVPRAQPINTQHPRPPPTPSRRMTLLGKLGAKLQQEYGSRQTRPKPADAPPLGQSIRRRHDPYAAPAVCLMYSIDPRRIGLRSGAVGDDAETETVVPHTQGLRVMSRLVLDIAAPITPSSSCEGEEGASSWGDSNSLSTASAPTRSPSSSPANFPSVPSTEGHRQAQTPLPPPSSLLFSAPTADAGVHTEHAGDHMQHQQQNSFCRDPYKWRCLALDLSEIASPVHPSPTDFPTKLLRTGATTSRQEAQVGEPRRTSVAVSTTSEVEAGRPGEAASAMGTTPQPEDATTRKTSFHPSCSRNAVHPLSVLETLVFVPRVWTPTRQLETGKENRGGPSSSPPPAATSSTSFTSDGPSPPSQNKTDQKWSLRRRLAIKATDAVERLQQEAQSASESKDGHGGHSCWLLRQLRVRGVRVRLDKPDRTNPADTVADEIVSSLFRNVNSSTISLVSSGRPTDDTLDGGTYFSVHITAKLLLGNNLSQVEKEEEEEGGPTTTGTGTAAGSNPLITSDQRLPRAWGELRQGLAQELGERIGAAAVYVHLQK